ncbi:hypothetical protein D3C72_2433380 [compost metagenome]
MREAGVLDELFMTLSPKIQGGHGMATMFEGSAHPPASLETAKLLSVYEAGGELFLRYALSEAAQGIRG